MLINMSKELVYIYTNVMYSFIIRCRKKHLPLIIHEIILSSS